MAFADAIPLLLVVVVVLIFATLGFSRVLTRRRGEAKPLAPVAVPPEETELEEGPVTCCMRCGSPSLRQPRLSEGLIPGVGDGLVWICGRCRWRGQPLTFDDVTAYRRFVMGLNDDASATAEASPEEKK